MDDSSSDCTKYSDAMSLTNETMDFRQVETQLLILRQEIHNLSQTVAGALKEPPGDKGRSASSPVPYNMSNVNQISTNPFITSTPSKQASETKFTLECKDIEVLRMEDLYDLHTKANIRHFIRQVEAVSTDPGRQKTIALTRMDKELRFYVESELSKLLHLTTFADITNILQTHFKRGDIVDSFRELFNMRYSFDEPPRRFIQRFNSRVTAICQDNPESTTTSREEWWKDIIMDSLPTDIKKELKLFSKKGLEETFIREVERIRSTQLRRPVASVARVNESGSEKGTPPELAASRTNLFTSKPPRYCRWCSDGSVHFWHQCPRKPTPNSCYDCLQLAARRGHPGCPGRISQVQTRPPHLATNYSTPLHPHRSPFTVPPPSHVTFSPPPPIKKEM